MASRSVASALFGLPNAHLDMARISLDTAKRITDSLSQGLPVAPAMASSTITASFDQLSLGLSTLASEGSSAISGKHAPFKYGSLTKCSGDLGLSGA